MNSKTRSYVRRMTPNSKTFTPVSKKLTETINLVDSTKKTKPDSKIMTYGIGLVVLAILGVNVILYLGIYTEAVADFFRPIFKKIAGIFGYTLAEGTKAAANVTAKGATAAVDVTSNVTKEVVDIGKDATVSSINLAQDLTNTDETDFKILKKKLENNKKNYQTPQPDEQGSEIQQKKSKEKSGYCFIGKHKGIRSCMKVDENDVCISGDIFPSRDICINPSLRS